MHIRGDSRNIITSTKNIRQRIPLSVVSNGNIQQRDLNQVQNQKTSIPVFQDREEVPCFEHVEFPIGYPYDPQNVSEYVHIIYRSMRLREEFHPQFNVVQREITSHDRSDAVHWLCETHYKCQLTTETLHRSIGILDRIIAATSIPLSQLHLICCGAIMIASKIEDMEPIKIKDILKITGKKFEPKELKDIEINIYNIIGYETEFPTPLFFLNILLRLNGQMTKPVMLFARYVIEVCFTSEHFMNVKPSALASTALMITRTFAGVEPWTETLSLYTQYSFEDLCRHCKVAHKLLLKVGADDNNFIRRKYSIDEFENVSDTIIPKELPFPFTYYN